MNVKKHLIVLFILGMALQSFTGLSEKEVIGSWKYEIEINYEVMTGILKFEKKEGKLTGEVQTDMGDYFALTNVEIKENNILYFELVPEYEVMKANLTVEDKKFTGTIGNYEGEIAITGEKVE